MEDCTMDMKIRYTDGVGVVSIAGELDAHTSSELTDFFRERVERDCLQLVADLDGLTYSSSAGIRVFLGLARDARHRGGDFRIAAVRPQVDKIFRLSKFDKVVRVFPTVDEAVESYIMERA